MSNEFDEINEGGLDRHFLFDRPPEDRIKNANTCTHPGCIKMRANFLLLPDYGEDERVKAVVENKHFGRLASVTLVLAPITGKSPSETALIIAEAGRIAASGVMEKADITDDEIRKVTADDDLLKRLVADPSWSHDAGVFIVTTMRAGANPLTIGVGVMALVYAFEDGKYVSYTPDDADLGRTGGPVDQAVLTGDDILALSGIGPALRLHDLDPEEDN